MALQSSVPLSMTNCAVLAVVVVLLVEFRLRLLVVFADDVVVKLLPEDCIMMLFPASSAGRTAAKLRAAMVAAAEGSKSLCTILLGGVGLILLTDFTSFNCKKNLIVLSESGFRTKD